MRQKLLTKITLSGLLLSAASAFTTQAATPTGPQGAATAKEFLNLSGGVAIQEMRDLPIFPNTPDVVAYPQRLEWPTGPNDTTAPAGNVKNNYGVLIQGYIYPPLDGDYVFAMASDDNGEFWLSTDDKPANIAQICAEPTWNPVRAFSAVTRRNPDAPENVSAKIKLVKGKAYYFEALMKEGGGGDNLAVAWQKPGDALPPQNGDLPIPGKYLATIDKTFPSPEVLGSSASLFGVSFTVVEGAAGSATIDAASVKVTIDGTVATHAIAKDGSLSTISTTSTAPFASDSKHTANLSFKDSAGKAISSDLSFTTQHYANLTAADSVTADTTKKGFLWRVSHIASGQPNTLAFTELQLAGIAKDVDGNILTNDADPNSVGPAKGPGKTVDGGLVEFEIEGVINLSQTADTLIGNFQPDLAMPGIPDALDNIAAEIITYIDMPAGFIQMGVNSDDGFRTTVNGANLGQFDGGRGAADTIFTVFVEQAGVYPFRTIYEEGGGDANVEWFTVKSDGKKVLVNDTANGGLPAYRAAAAGSIIVKSVSPAPGSAEVATAPNIGAIINDGGAVDKASVKLNVAGKDVTAKVDQAGGTTTVSYTPSPDLDTSTTVPVILSFKSTAGVSRSVSWSFTTTILGKETLYIEAEDFNFDNGKTITDKNIGMDKKPYAGGDFRDLGTEADAEIDYHNPGGNAGQAYRAGTAVAAGKENGTAGSFRGYFDVTSFWTVGWNDAGDWQNYTRTFPTPATKYNVYGHVSSGGSPINFELAEVTSDPTKTDQTTKLLAVCAPGRATAGWDVLEIFPFTDAGTQTPAVVELGGKVTLRITLPSGNGDIDYIAFVPAKTGGGGGTPPALSVAKTAGKVVITYEGTLQGSDTINGTFTDVAGATSPFTADTTKGAKFYKAKR